MILDEGNIYTCKACPDVNWGFWLYNGNGLCMSCNGHKTPIKVSNPTAEIRQKAQTHQQRYGE